MADMAIGETKAEQSNICQMNELSEQNEKVRFIRAVGKRCRSWLIEMAVVRKSTIFGFCFAP